MQSNALKLKGYAAPPNTGANVLFTAKRLSGRDFTLEYRVLFSTDGGDAAT
jgi:hypothetical protein